LTIKVTFISTRKFIYHISQKNSVAGKIKQQKNTGKIKYFRRITSRHGLIQNEITVPQAWSLPGCCLSSGHTLSVLAAAGNLALQAAYPAARKKA